MERNCEPMNKNLTEGAAEHGERAKNREALVIKAKRRRSGGCAAKECDPYLGRSRLMPERAMVQAASEKSAAAIVVQGETHYGKRPKAKGQTRRSVKGHDDVRGNASDAHASGAGQRSVR